MNGSVILVKALSTHEIWLEKPFDRAHAWVDLLLLANDADREPILRGEAVVVRRGQLAWSVAGLADRWGWCFEKTRGWLQILQKKGMVQLDLKKRSSLITIANYAVYQGQTPETAPESESVTEPESGLTTAPESESVTEPERKGKGKGKGKYPAAAVEEGGNQAELPGSEIPSDEEFGAFADQWPGEPATGLSPGIPRAYADDWMSKRLSSGSVFPRDWQRALVCAYRSAWRLGYRSAQRGQKNAGPGFDRDDLLAKRDAALAAGNFAEAGRLEEAIA